VPALAVPQLALVVAVADNGIIGRGGTLPWRLPEDLRRFRANTMGKPMLMGRRTFESIGKALPGRTSIVLTRSRGWWHPEVLVAHSLAEALERARGAAELAVIGGAEIYALTLPLARRIYLTRVHAIVSGDTHLPPLDGRDWRELWQEDYPADARNEHAMTFSLLERREVGPATAWRSPGAAGAMP
jgi:dihydrofolate reductase